MSGNGSPAPHLPERPGCPLSPQRGKYGNPHNYSHAISPLSGRIWLFCTMCGSTGPIAETIPGMEGPEPEPNEMITGEESESIPADDPEQTPSN